VDNYLAVIDTFDVTFDGYGGFPNRQLQFLRKLLGS
jgi:hypothetical protein